MTHWIFLIGFFKKEEGILTHNVMPNHGIARYTLTDKRE